MVERLRTKYNTEISVNTMNVDVALTGHKRFNTELGINTMTAEISSIFITPLTYFIFLDDSFVVNNSGDFFFGIGELD